jgi:hypothetical protein
MALAVAQELLSKFGRPAGYAGRRYWRGGVGRAIRAVL